MTDAATALGQALEEQRDRLLPCVHCGFCLSACPTYRRLGDEADSPRGRLHLMGAVVDGRLSPDSDAFRTHIDRCLGCRACEPVCPSGVEYGALLERAREAAARARPPALPVRLLLRTFRGGALQSLFFLGGRLLRGSGLARLGARLLPSVGIFRGPRLGLAMLAATRPWKRLGSADRVGPGDRSPAAARGHPETAAGGVGASAAADPPPPAGRRGRVALLTGCVQQGLFARVNAATERVLEANGFEVVRVKGQGCCGALHAHGGALDEARRLARGNVQAFGPSDVDHVVVNAAGCGATMKEYGELLGQDGEELATRVRDLAELLVEVGVREGAAVPCSLAYDHPCHLLHAQGIRQAPLELLAAVPGVEVRVVENADECCGGAGIYGITHPELGGRIGGDKVAAVRRCGADAVATPNPGCMMQIGGGLLLEGSEEGVVHPVEVLDESYRRAGFYQGGEGG